MDLVTAQNVGISCQRLLFHSITEPRFTIRWVNLMFHLCTVLID